MVDHHIVRLDISVHDALAVAEIQRLQQLENIVANVVVNETRVELAEVGIVDVFEDQTRSFTLAVSYNVQ